MYAMKKVLKAVKDTNVRIPMSLAEIIEEEFDCTIEEEEGSIF